MYLHVGTLLDVQVVQLATWLASAQSGRGEVRGRVQNRILPEGNLFFVVVDGAS